MKNAVVLFDSQSLTPAQLCHVWDYIVACQKLEEFLNAQDWLSQLDALQERLREHWHMGSAHDWHWLKNNISYTFLNDGNV